MERIKTHRPNRYRQIDPDLLKDDTKAIDTLCIVAWGAILTLTVLFWGWVILGIEL